MLCESYGDDRFDFRRLGDRRQLKLELQYALQCQDDQRQVKTPAAVARPVITLAASSPVSSLLDWSPEQWSEFFDERHAAKHGQNGQLAFLRYAHGRLEDLQSGSGWEAEFPRDVWELRRLGIEGRKRLRFDGIPQPWLRQLAKRFARWRLSIGRSPIQTYVDVQAVTRLARFLDSPPVNVTTLAGVDRVILERYLADLATDPRAVRSRSRDISSLGAFLDAVRRHQWDRSLPASASFYLDDFPKPEKRLPRGLAEHVMAQVEQSANLDGWNDPGSRLLTVILMRCGLRVGDAVKVAFDCVVRDGDGAPYLRYDNRKMKREALVPIDEEVEQGITAQQQRILARWPGGVPGLFPAPKMNPDGRRPLSTHSYRGQLRDWLERCDVRDEHGRPVRLTPHQWRHTFGTRLKMGRIASDATFPGKRDHAPAGDASRGQGWDVEAYHRESAGHDGCVNIGCIRVIDDAPDSDAPGDDMLRLLQRQKRSDEGRCPPRPVVTLTHSACGQQCSLPVLTEMFPRKWCGFCSTTPAGR